MDSRRATGLGMVLTTIVLVLTPVICAFAHERVTALSGVPTFVNGHSRFDQEGRNYPVSISVTSQPAHGTVQTRVKTLPRRQRDGSTRVVRETQVIYQSKKGYIGDDTFTYRRVSTDPSDPRNNRELTIQVTVR